MVLVKSKLQSIVLNVALGALILVAIFVLIHLLDKRKYKVDNSWVKSNGTLCVISRGGRGAASKFKYSFNDQEYVGYSSYNVSVFHNIPGEKFSILINSKKPDDYIPIEWEPMFIQGERTSFTRGFIVSIENDYKLVFGDSLVSSHEVIFAYETVAGKYERGQALSPRYTDLYPALGAGDIYEIEYFVENPQRAIIHLDKPLK